MKFICEDTLLERCLDWTAHNTESGHVKLSAHDHEVVSRSTDNKDTLVSVSAVHSLLLRRIRLGQLSEGQLNSPALKGIVMGLASDDPGLLERYVDALRDDPTDISNGPRGSGRVLSCRQVGKAELERYRSKGWFLYVTNISNFHSVQRDGKTLKHSDNFTHRHAFGPVRDIDPVLNNWRNNIGPPNFRFLHIFQSHTGQLSRTERERFFGDSIGWYHSDAECKKERPILWRKLLEESRL
eukprot:PhM_4_TR16757/c0_g2_i3/m.26636